LLALLISHRNLILIRASLGTAHADDLSVRVLARSPIRK